MDDYIYYIVLGVVYLVVLLGGAISDCNGTDDSYDNYDDYYSGNDSSDNYDDYSTDDNSNDTTNDYYGDSSSNDYDDDNSTTNHTIAINLKAVADTYITDAFPDSNFGSEQIFFTGNVYDDNYWGFVRFDTSSIPSDATIIKATLYLCSGFNNTPDEAKPKASVEVSEVLDSSWTELNIDYISMPSHYKYISQRDVTFDITQWYTWNITEAVQDWVSGTNSNLGLRINSYNIDNGAGSTNAHCGFYSRELSSDAGPLLAVEYK